MARKIKSEKLGVSEAEVIYGSGNVFADIGVNNPEEALTKVRLAQHLSALIDDLGLTQTKVAEILGVDQPKISRLCKGQLRDFSIHRLLAFIAALGQQVEVVIKSPLRKKHRKALKIRLFAA